MTISQSRTSWRSASRRASGRERPAPGTAAIGLLRQNAVRLQLRSGNAVVNAVLGFVVVHKGQRAVLLRSMRPPASMSGRTARWWCASPSTASPILSQEVLERQLPVLCEVQIVVIALLVGGHPALRKAHHKGDLLRQARLAIWSLWCRRPGSKRICFLTQLTGLVQRGL